MRKLLLKTWSWLKSRFVFGAAGVTIAEGTLHSAVLVTSAWYAASTGLVWIALGLGALAMIEFVAPLYLAWKATRPRVQLVIEEPRALLAAVSG